MQCRDNQANTMNNTMRFVTISCENKIMKLPKVVSLVLIIALLGGCGAPAAVSASAAPSASAVSTPLPTPSVYSADLFMVGDCLMHLSVTNDGRQEDGKYDYSKQFAQIAAMAKNYDLLYYNQESILGGEELGYSGYPQFNTSDGVGETLIRDGFNMVSLANNHALDMGAAGIEHSMAFWRSHPEVCVSGTNLSEEERKKIPVICVNGITAAFLSWTYGTNGLNPPEGKEYLVNVYAGHEEEMLEQVRSADKLADIVIIAMHWGVEYTLKQTSEQERLAQELSDAGADLIIGCHPHVIEPVTWINGKTLCFYSLGNMISAQTKEATHIGMAGGVTITKTVQPDGSSSTVLSNPRADLFYNSYKEGANGFYDFREIPFTELEDANMQAMYQKYLPVITSLDSTISIGV